MEKEVVRAPRPSLTIGAAARQLGVAVATLRSWETRYGLGPLEHVTGAHRRYAPADMDRLERFCRLVGDGASAADAARAVLAGYAAGPDPARAGGGRTLPVGRTGDAAARGLARSAMRMDTPQVLELLDAALARDGAVAAWEQTIAPALLAVGRKWTETTGRYVEVEHLLSWSVAAALHRRLPGPGAKPPPSGRTVLLACAPGEWHCLPLEVLNLALIERNVPVRMLGVAVPREALEEAARRIGPARVVVWSQTPHTADPRALPGPQGRTVTLAAGPGWLGVRQTCVPVLATLAEAVEACTG